MDEIEKDKYSVLFIGNKPAGDDEHLTYAIIYTRIDNEHLLIRDILWRKSSHPKFLIPLLNMLKETKLERIQKIVFMAVKGNKHHSTYEKLKFAKFENSNTRELINQAVFGSSNLYINAFDMYVFNGN